MKWWNIILQILGTIILFYFATYVTDFIFGGNRTQERRITVALILGTGYGIYNIYKSKKKAQINQDNTQP